MAVSLICGSCGSAVYDGARYCPSCGRATDGTPPPPPSTMPMVVPVGYASPPPAPLAYYQHPAASYAQMAAATRSYTTPAVIVMILYFVLWIPGLIANLVYLHNANEDRDQTGIEPQGRGCLVALIFVFGVLPFLLGGGFFGLVFLLAALA